MKLKITERSFAAIVLAISLLVLCLLWSYRPRSAEISAQLSVAKISFEVAQDSRAFGDLTLSLDTELARSISNLHTIRSSEWAALERAAGDPIFVSSERGIVLPALALTPDQKISLEVIEGGVGVLSMTRTPEMELLAVGSDILTLTQGAAFSRMQVDASIPVSFRASARASAELMPVVFELTQLTVNPCASTQRVPLQAPVAVDIPVKRVNFTRETRAGGLANRSAILAGQVRTLDDGSELVVSSVDTLELTIRSGVIRELFIDSCGVRLQLDATVDEFRTGSSHQKVDRMPTLLSQLAFQRSVSLLLVSLFGVWGFLWSVRTLFIAKET